LTATGEQELTRILLSAEDEEDRRFNMRLAFFRYVEPAARLRLLKRRRTHVVARLKSAQTALQQAQTEGPIDHYTAALLRHNIRNAEADVAWLDQLIAFARTEQTPEEPRTLTGGIK
jgi:hypothetical protein